MKWSSLFGVVKCFESRECEKIHRGKHMELICWISDANECCAFTTVLACLSYIFHSMFFVPFFFRIHNRLCIAWMGRRQPVPNQLWFTFSRFGVRTQRNVKTQSHCVRRWSSSTGLDDNRKRTLFSVRVLTVKNHVEFLFQQKVAHTHTSNRTVPRKWVIIWSPNAKRQTQTNRIVPRYFGLVTEFPYCEITQYPRRKCCRRWTHTERNWTTILSDPQTHTSRIDYLEMFAI